MSEAILRAGLDASGYVTGARTVTKANLDMEQSAIRTNSAIKGLEGRFGGIGSSSQTGFGAAKAALRELEHPIKDFGNWIDMIRDRILRIGATVIVFQALGAAIGAIAGFFKGAIKAVDDFQVATIQIAAGLTQIAANVKGANIATEYEKSSLYAGALAIKLQEVDRNSLANYQGLQAMLQVMTAQGVVLDINKEKQVKAFTDISNAIALYTVGQDQQRQMFQETRSLMTGQVNMNSQLSRILDQQIKQQGVYKGGLKEVVDLGRRQVEGLGVLERLAPYLVGINAASKDISQTWTAVVTSFETALGIVQRNAFGPIMKDLVQIVGFFSDTLRENASVIGSEIQDAWKGVRDTIFVIDETTQKISINPELLTTLKSMGNLLLGMGKVFLDVTSFILRHSEAIKDAVVAYLAFRVASTANTAILRIGTAAQMESITALIAKQQAMISLGLTEQQLTAIEQQSLVVTNSRNMAEGARITASLARAEASAVAMAAAKAEMANNMANVVETIRVAAVDLEAAAAKKVRSAASIELARNEVAVIAAMTEYEGVSNFNTYSDRDAVVAKNALIQANFRHLGTIEAEILARNALKASVASILPTQIAAIQADNMAVVASQRHNAALVALGATTGFVSAEQLRNNQIKFISASASARATAITLAHSEALAMNAAMTARATIASRALAVATTALNGALSLVGGPLGAIMLALMLGAYWWNKWGNAAEKAKKQAAEDLGDYDKTTAGIESQNRATMVKLQLIEKLKRNESLAPDKQEPVTEAEKVAAAMGPAYDKYNERLSKVVQYDIRIKELEADINKTRAANLDEKGFLAFTRKQREEVNLLKTARDNEFNSAERAKRAYVLQADLQPKAPDQPKYPGKDDGTGSSKQRIIWEKDLHKEWLAYLRNVSAYEIAIEKENAQSRQIVIDEQYRTAQISQATHIQMLHDSKMDMLKRNHKVLEEFQQQSGVELNEYAREKHIPTTAYNQDTGIPNQAGIDAYVGTFGGSDKDKKAYNERVKNIKELLGLIKVWDNANLARIQNEKNGEQEIAKNIIEKQKLKEAEIKQIEDGNIAKLKSMGLEVQAFEASITTAEYKRTVTDVNSKRLQDAEDMLGLSYMLTDAERKQAEEALANAKKILATQEEKEASLRRQAKITEAMNAYDIKKMARDTQTAASAYDASMVGRSSETGIVSNEYANAMAVEDDRYASVMAHLQDELDFKNNMYALTEQGSQREESARLAVLEVERKINEEKNKGITNKGKINADTEIGLIKSIETQAQKLYPKITSIAAISWMGQQAAAKKYTDTTTIGVGTMTKGSASMITDFASLGASVFNDLAASTDQSTRAGFESAKAYSLAGAVMSTAAAVMSQLASMPGPAGWKAAAAAAALGIVQIAKIASTSYGGGGSVATVSAGSFGGSGMAQSSVGGSIGAPIQSIRDSQSQEDLQRIAGAMENASLAIGKVADGLTDIATLFKEGGFMSLAAGAAPGIGDSISDPSKTGILKTFMKNPLDVFKGVGSTLFGWGNSWQQTGGGVSLGLSGGTVMAQSFVNEIKKGGWFTSDKKRTTYGEADPAFTAVVQNAINSITSTINRSAVATGTFSELDKAKVAPINIATAGRTGEDIAKDLEAWLMTASDELAKTVVGLQDFAFYGENAFEALVRLSTALQSTNEGLELIGARLINSTLHGANAAYKLQELMGGSEAFADAVDNYFTIMFDDQEQAAMKAAQAQREVNVAFAEMGIIAPTTKDQFKNLVNGLDVATDSGARTFAALMDVASSFGVVMDQVDALNEKMKEYTNNFRNYMNDISIRNARLDGRDTTVMELGAKHAEEMEEALRLVSEGLLIGSVISSLATVQYREMYAALQKVGDAAAKAANTLTTSNINEFIDAQIAILNMEKTIMTGPQSKLSPEAAYLQAKGEFDRLKDNTDLESLKLLPNAANALLTASSNYNASGLAYQTDLHAVLQALGTAGGLADPANPTLEALQNQIQLLTDIKKALTEPASTSPLALLASTLTSGPLIDLISQLIGYAGITPTTVGGVTTTTGTEAATAAAVLNSTYTKLQSEVFWDEEGLFFDLWKKVATGEEQWIEVGQLPQFAKGGIATGPSIFGEGSMFEAAVPLPDGRTIPVTLSGGNDKETAEELRIQNALLREILAIQQANVRVNHAGFTGLIDVNTRQERSAASMADSARLEKSK